MATPSEIESKRRLLIEGLIICLQHSAEVKALVPADTARSVFGSASSDLWREGGFRLETVWKILCQQPGLDPNTAALPLLAFKSFESILGVTVILPSALTSIAPDEQARLASLLPLDAEQFSSLLKQAVVDSAPVHDVAEMVAAAASDSGGGSRAGGPGARSIGTGPIVGLVTAVVIALLFVVLGRPSKMDVSMTSSVLVLDHATRQSKAMTATIIDARWASMAKDEKTRVAQELFKLVAGKGIEDMALTDESGAVAVFARQADGEVHVLIP